MSASPDPRGGRWATGVPTAIGALQRANQEIVRALDCLTCLDLTCVALCFIFRSTPKAIKTF